MKKTKWNHLERNSVLDSKEGFYISYNINPGMGFSLFASDNNSEETALVQKKRRPYSRVLNGDFRKNYEKIIDKGWKVCLAFYNKKKKKFGSSWTN